MTDDPIQNVEQRNSIKNIAELTHVYFSELCAHGMTRVEALELTHTWLAASLNQGGSNE